MEKRKFLTKEIIGNPWPLQMYTSQSLNTVYCASLVDGTQKYVGIRKVIYKMSRSVLLCTFCEHQMPFLGESVPRDILFK